MSNSYEVGKEIEAYCTKCKIDRLHVIESLKTDGTINRVLCRTCGGSHQFRRPKSEAAGARRSPRTTARRRAKGAVILTPEEAAGAKRYTMDGHFEVGDIIRHTTFGSGKVVEVRSDGKIEVGFETGGKLLVSGSR